MLQLYDIMKYGSAMKTIFKTNFLDINQLYAWQYFLLQSNNSHIEKQVEATTVTRLFVLKRKQDWSE